MADCATNASANKCSPVSLKRRIIEAWRIDYNIRRPHTSLDGLTPTEFAARPNQGHNQNRLSL